MIEAPDFDPTAGVSTVWEADAVLSVSLEHGGVRIVGNAAGLLSLARHALVLSQEAMPVGRHLHLDDWSGLSPGSVEVVLERG